MLNFMHLLSSDILTVILKPQIDLSLNFGLRILAVSDT